MARSMSTKEPDLQDFGITSEEYAIYKGYWHYRQDRTVLFGVSVVVIGFVVALVALAVTQDLGTALGLGIMTIFPGFIVVGGVVGYLIEAIGWFKRRLLLKSPIASRIKLYDEVLTAWREAEEAQREAERAQHRKLREYWMSLSGVEFERELGTLYKRLGHRVESTPHSGDQGIDLILRKDSRTTVVQCKSHQAPIGPAAARELLGSLVASGADSAILACTGGFTRGVREFVRGKQIALVSASDLAALGGTVEGKTLDMAYSTPICPMSGCRKEMVLRTGRHGEFWGCPRFPRCRGTRPSS